MLPFMIFLLFKLIITFFADTTGIVGAKKVKFDLSMMYFHPKTYYLLFSCSYVLYFYLAVPIVACVIPLIQCKILPFQVLVLTSAVVLFLVLSECKFQPLTFMQWRAPHCFSKRSVYK